jgi:predicted RNA methylase
VYRRVGSILVLWSVLTLALMGCGVSPVGLEEPAERPDGPNGVCTVNLSLPESSVPLSYAPERVSKLTIDGRDYSLPRAEKRTVKVDRPADTKAQVTIVFSFWPNTYTNIIRTKKVTLPADKTLDVNMTAKQDDDDIRPIFVPTPNEVVEEMCKMAKIGKDDVVYDIGCGDGRLVITAVKKFGAKKGVGLDINEELIVKCKENAKKAMVDNRVEFRAGDALKIKDWSEATVMLLYLGDHLNEALRPSLQKTLKPGSRIVSHRFKMGDWKPEVSKTITAKNNYNEREEYHLHLWTIKK